MFVTNWILTTKIQKISEITNFFRHYFLSRTEVYIQWYFEPIQHKVTFKNSFSKQQLKFHSPFTINRIYT